jgi:hypothetical protein
MPRLRAGPCVDPRTPSRSAAGDGNPDRRASAGRLSGMSGPLEGGHLARQAVNLPPVAISEHQTVRGWSLICACWCGSRSGRSATSGGARYFADHHSRACGTATVTPLHRYARGMASAVRAASAAGPHSQPRHLAGGGHRGQGGQGRPPAGANLAGPRPRAPGGRSGTGAADPRVGRAVCSGDRASRSGAGEAAPAAAGCPVRLCAAAGGARRQHSGGAKSASAGAPAATRAARGR